VNIDPASVDFADDHALAAYLAHEAGVKLNALRDTMFAERATSWDVKDAGDAVGHRYLVDELAEHRPNDAVLSEEGADNSKRLSADRVWIIDPLDGTNEYGEQGRADWAIHVALWEKGDLVAGAVALPALGLTLSTHPDSRPTLTPPPQRRTRLITSRNRAPYSAILVANAIDCDAIRLGSAGAKAMAVVMGEADIYVHDGGQHQWDSAAPVAVARAAGLHTSRIDGSPLVYNERDTWLPDLLICRPELAEPVLRALWGDQIPTS
jgi:3'(2'), 5'-bisphosphate nucleotidase